MKLLKPMERMKKGLPKRSKVAFMSFNSFASFTCYEAPEANGAHEEGLTEEQQGFLHELQ